MREDTPSKPLPMLLSFCGSRRKYTLPKKNNAWSGTMKDKRVRRVPCEDIHKAVCVVMW